MNAEGASRKIRWGIVGASRIADEYVIPAIAADDSSTVVALGTSSAPAQAKAIASRHGVDRVYDSIDEVFDDPDIDVVYIGSASEHHLGQILAAAAAGKHVFCDKPLALTAGDAINALDACQSNGVLLGVNQQVRGAATHRAMRNAVLDGAIGEVRGARCAFTVQLPPHATGWRTSGPAAGVAMDLTVHTADTLRALLGADVEAVAAFGANQGLCEAPHFDLLFGAMHFDNGVIATFQDAFTIGHSQTALEVYGSTGSVIGTDVMRQSPGGNVVLRRGDESTELHIDHHDLYEPAVAAFNLAVQGKGEPAATGLDGLKALQIAEAVVTSAQTRQFVELPAQ
ncbi:MAG: fructose reductase [Amycolatopsis sp.]|uniref:Gfo/Idh/MocA family protein n=1 Tax=Amycolatopsis sp. TaxID=37632 RepID=UPI002620FC21|nr:Gfo/Idh/MocA family oxidoreductase [Amycolatopsis sp.]MCU1682620.1 fructose reductase [Amycolatopsis sp.]